MLPLCAVGALQQLDVHVATAGVGLVVVVVVALVVELVALQASQLRNNSVVVGAVGVVVAVQMVNGEHTGRKNTPIAVDGG